MILFASNDPILSETLTRTLQRFENEVFSTSSLQGITGLLKENTFGILILDMGLLRDDGPATLEEIRGHLRDGEIYLIAGTSEIQDIYSIPAGLVDDFFFKPLNPDLFALNIESSCCGTASESRSLTVVEPYIEKLKPYILFQSREMKRVLMNLPRIAGSNQTVLISGETGTGKELVARALHILSPRAEGTFVAVNCGAIPDSLFEGELFGHERGAFTGALKTHRGKIEVADGGTLFLDEIGDMPVSLQVKLLRVLEEGVIYRLGGERPIRVDVRVIAATRKDLSKSVEEGLFRDDLYYRLNVLRIHLPPLRERIDDIPLLARFFLHRALREIGYNGPLPVISPGTRDLLQRLRWRGNVRELRNLMTRIATFLQEGQRRILPLDVLPHLDEVTLRDILTRPESLDAKGVFIPIGTTLREAEDILIEETLRHTGGNRTKAAKILGIGIRTLRRRLNQPRGQIDL